MRLGFATKRFNLIITYRESEEPDVEYVSNLDGDFDPAPKVETEESEVHFGFAVNRG